MEDDNENEERSAGSAVLLKRLDAARLGTACNDAIAHELALLSSQLEDAASALERARSVHAALAHVEQLHKKRYRSDASFDNENTVDAVESVLAWIGGRMRCLQPCAIASSAIAPVSSDQPRVVAPALDNATSNEHPPQAAAEADTLNGSTVPQPAAACPPEELANLVQSCLRRSVRLSKLDAQQLNITELQDLGRDLYDILYAVNRDACAESGAEDYERSIVTPVADATSLLLQTLWRYTPKSRLLVRIVCNLNQRLRVAQHPLLSCIRQSERVSALMAVILRSVAPSSIHIQLRHSFPAFVIWYALGRYPCGSRNRHKAFAAVELFKKEFRLLFTPPSAEDGNAFEEPSAAAAGRTAAVAFFALALHVDVVVKFATPAQMTDMISGLHELLESDLIQPKCLLDRQLALLHQAQDGRRADASIDLDFENESRVIHQALAL